MTWRPDYITAADVAAYLRVGDTVDNVQFGLWATASSRAVDRRCQRQFGQLAAPEARTYRRRPVYVRALGLWHVEIDDLQDATGFLVDGVAYASSGAVLLPETAPDDGVPWTALGFSSCPTWPGVHTGRWGWAGIPSQVKTACQLQSARWNFRRDAPSGVAGSPEQGSEVRMLSKLDPDVAVSLIGLSRPRRAA